MGIPSKDRPTVIILGVLIACFLTYFTVAVLPRMRSSNSDGTAVTTAPPILAPGVGIASQLARSPGPADADQGTSPPPPVGRDPARTR